MSPPACLAAQAGCSLQPAANMRSPLTTETTTACCLLPTCFLCQERSSQGPQDRKQETAAFLSSDEDHGHMATLPPPACPPGGSASNPRSLARSHVGQGCFQFPFPGGWKIPAAWAQMRNGRHSPPGRLLPAHLPAGLFPSSLSLHPTLCLPASRRASLLMKLGQAREGQPNGSNSSRKDLGWAQPVVPSRINVNQT